MTPARGKMPLAFHSICISFVEIIFLFQKNVDFFFLFFWIQQKEIESKWWIAFQMNFYSMRNWLKVNSFRIIDLKVGDSVFVGDVPRVRLDGGSRHFRRRWGYDAAGGGAPASLLEDIDEDADDYYSDTYSLRGELFLGGESHQQQQQQQQPAQPTAAQGQTRPLSHFFISSSAQLGCLPLDGGMMRSAFIHREMAV